MSLPPTDIGTTDAAAPSPGSPRPSPTPQDPVNLKLDMLVHGQMEAWQDAKNAYARLARRIWCSCAVTICGSALLFWMLR